MLIRSARATLASASRLVSTSVAAGENAGAAPSTATKSGGGKRDTLGRRLLSLVYPKRSAVIAIRKWKEEGRSVRKYELNRVVRELRKLRRYKHALEICEWMTLQEDIKLQPGDYAVHLDLISKVRGLNSAEKFFMDVPDKMRGHATCTALLHSYVQNNLPDKAEALMQKMSECGFLKSPLPYNHMITLYLSKGDREKVLNVIQELKKNTSPDVVTYNLWLTALASDNDVESVEKVFLKLKKAKLDPDWMTYSILTNLYAKTGHHERAESTVKEMEKRASQKHRVAYASLISLFAIMGNKDGVHRIWKRMKSCFPKMNDAEYTSIISSLVKLGQFDEAKNLYDEWESVSGTGDSRVSNIILAEYVNRGQIHVAEEFYKRITQKGIDPSYTTWEILAWGYLKHKWTGKVLDCFENAIGSVKKWNPNVKMVREVWKELQDQGDTEGAERFLNILRKAGYVDTETYNSLLRTYAKAGKMPLIIEERMEKENVPLNGDTRELIKLTSKMRVSDVSFSESQLDFCEQRQG